MGIFRRFWAGYAVILFLLMMLVLSVPVLLFNMAATPGEKALRRNIYFLHHPFTRIFFALTGVRMKIYGAEHIKKDQSYVIVGNHRSAIDFMVNASAFPGIFRFLAKEELLKVPVFGWVVKKMCLTVDRKSAMSRARSVINLKQQLADGMNIFIYPEGGRNRSDEPLAPFYDGAFRIALQTKAPIIVQTVANITSVTGSVHSIDFQPGVLHIHCDPPIETDQYSVDHIPELKEKVRQMMLQHLKY